MYITIVNKAFLTMCGLLLIQKLIEITVNLGLYFLHMKEFTNSVFLITNVINSPKLFLSEEKVGKLEI